MITLLSIVLVTSILACISWIVYIDMIPKAKQDDYRQELFTLRSELFFYAKEGNIDFTNPAYKMMRETLNGFTQYANRINFIHFQYSVEWRKNHRDEFQQYLNLKSKYFNGLNEEQKTFILEIEKKMHRHTRALLFSNSPILGPIIKAVLMIEIVHNRLRKYAPHENLEILIDKEAYTDHKAGITSY